MSDLGALEVVVRAIVGRDYDKDLDEAKDKAAKAGQGIAAAIDKETAGIGTSIADRLSGIGSALNKTVLPAAAAVTGAAALIGNSWRNAGRDLQSTTGAAGQALADLEKSMQNVAGTVKGGIGLIADVMGDISAKTHLTGKPLEELVRTLLALKEIGREVSAADLGGAFGKWAIPTDQWASALDRLLKISQETGVSIPTLLGRLADFQPVLASLGYNFDQATLLAARLPDIVLPGLRTWLGNVSKAQGDLADSQLKAEAAQVAYTAAVDKYGDSSLQARQKASDLADANALVAAGSVDTKAAFDGMLGSIKGAATEQEALTIATDAFGSKAGPGLVQAVRTGKFELDKLSESVAANGNTAVKTADKQRSLVDKFGLMKEKVEALAGPLATQVTAFGALATGAGPIVKGVGSLLSMFNPAKAAEIVATGVGLDSVAVGETATGVAAGAAVGPTTGFAASMVALAAPILAVVGFIALVVTAGYLLVKNWDDVKAGAAVVWGWIQDFFGAVVGFLIDHWTLLLGPIGLIIDQWGTLKSVAGDVWGWIQDKIGGVVDFIVGIPERIGGALSGVFDGLVAGFKSAWNGVASVVNKADFTFPSGIPIIGGKTIGLPDLPILDSGGILSAPGLWAKADFRPEVVAPLAGLGEMMASTGDGGGGGGSTTIIVQGSVLAERKLLNLAKGGAAAGRRYNVDSGLG